MELISRSEARDRKSARYFTGKLCKHGHVDERRTIDGGCVACGRLKDKAFRDRHPDRVKAKNKKQCDTNPVARRLASRLWNQNNREQFNLNHTNWRAKHRAYCKAKRLARHRRARQATPSWVNTSDLRSIYLSCPEGFHVDHSIPLTHDVVCGLHVPCNLESTSGRINTTKTNHFDPDEWHFNVTLSRFERRYKMTSPDFWVD